MNEKPGNKSAFPYTNCEDHGLNGGYGMTLRQWYAGMAMQGFLSTLRDDDFLKKEGAENIANEAFIAADALLAHEEGERDGGK